MYDLHLHNLQAAWIVSNFEIWWLALNTSPAFRVNYNMKFYHWLILTLAPISGLTASAQVAGVDYISRQVTFHDTTQTLKFVNDSSLYTDHWDAIAQPIFWRKVMQMPPDSAVVNVAATRKILFTIPMMNWHKKTKQEKETFKVKVRADYQLPADEKIYVTMGRNHFYQFRKAVPNIGKSVAVFESRNLDPWYCQAILLIESPSAYNGTSGVGAHGPFQLMKSVAQRRGLIVNKQKDEREDIEKAAVAAAKLIQYVCIPETKKMLDKYSVTYSETDLWFRLLVLHSYHAGSGNVSGVIDIIQPTKGGQELIQKVWQTEYKGFKNASQNYSQVALAALLTLNDLLVANPDTIHTIEGDILRKTYSPVAGDTAMASLNTLLEVKQLYHQDLMENRIPFEAYITRLQKTEGEIAALTNIPAAQAHQPLHKNEKGINDLGHKLIKQRRFKDGLACFQYNVMTHPKAWNAYDSLGFAHKKLGNKALAIDNYAKSLELNPKNYAGKKQLDALRGSAPWFLATLVRN